jgi:hypothetical protein
MVNSSAPNYYNPSLSFSGNPNASVDVAGFSTYIVAATYSITADDISNGYVVNSTIVNAHWSDDLGGSSTAYFPVCSTQLNVMATHEVAFENFIAYPNPVQNVWEVSNGTFIDQIEIINLLGQTVQSEKIQATSSKLDLSHLSTGTYLAKISAGNQVKIARIIKS